MHLPVLVTQHGMCCDCAVNRPLFFAREIEPSGRPTIIVNVRLVGNQSVRRCCSSATAPRNHLYIYIYFRMLG